MERRDALPRACPHCGQPQSAATTFCTYCGNPLPPPQPAHTARRRTPLIVGAAVLLFALAAGAAFLLGRTLQEQPGSEPSAQEIAGQAPDPAGTAVPGGGAAPAGAPTTAAALTATSQATAPSASPTTSPSPAATATAAPTPTAPALLPSPTWDLRPQRLLLGYSAGNKPIEAVRFGNGEGAVLFVGGLHAGFAPNTVALAQEAVEYFSDTPGVLPDGATLYIIPNLNPDAPHAPQEVAGRLNANGVDLNRNWPCQWQRDAPVEGEILRNSGGLQPFSEPETQALANLVEEKAIEAVIFWEARAYHGLVAAGLCGPESAVSGPLASIYGRATSYRVATFEELSGSVVHGDASNWLDQQGVASIAILLPSFSETDWENNRRAMEAILNAYAR